MKTEEFIKNFRDAMSNLTNGIAIVTVFDGSMIHGFTINSFNSVCLNPPCIIYNINKKTKNLDLFLNCKTFTINLLSEKQDEISNYFAQSEKEGGVMNKWFEFKDNNCVLIGGLSCFICKVFKIVEVGDHYLVIGEVIGLKNVSIDGKPLIYFRRGYHFLGGGDE